MVIRVEADVDVKVEVLVQSFRNELKLRVEVEIVPPGSLAAADEGPIRDERNWE